MLCFRKEGEGFTFHLETIEVKHIKLFILFLQN